MMRLLLYIHQLLFIPHVMLFFNHKNKQIIIEDLYCIEPKSHSTFKIANDLTKTLAQNKYFRTLFYFRTRGVFSNVLRVFYPRDNRFTIDINTKIDGGVVLAHPYSTIINAEKIGKNLYINQLVTIGEKDGTKHTQPVYGKDKQDALSRLINTERTVKVEKKLENNTGLIFMTWLAVMGAPAIFFGAQDTPWYLAYTFGGIMLLVTVTLLWYNYINKK